MFLKEGYMAIMFNQIYFPKSYSGASEEGQRGHFQSKTFKTKLKVLINLEKLIP